jgi:protein ImuB
VQRDMMRLKLIAHIAIADTIGAAWAAAFCASSRTSSSPMVVPAGGTLAFLQRIPVEALRIPSNVVGTLRELDLRTIGQIEQLPRETLPSRFGPELLLRLDQAAGRVAEWIVPVHPHEPVEARWGCEEPIDNALAIEATLKRLLDRVLHDVSARGEGILRLDVALICPAREPLRMTVDSLKPTLHHKQLLDLVRLQLERLHLTRGVVDFYLRATVTAPLEISQPDLFEEKQQRHAGRELDGLLGRLSSRLGRLAVLRPALLADHQPERAAGFRPVIGAAAEPCEIITPRHRCRPLRLLPQPLPVSVISVVPDGPPVRIMRHNGDHQIVYCEGPERIEVGWWREEAIRRDYYRVETDSGERYWLFRSINEGSWFLHGEF